MTRLIDQLNDLHDSYASAINQAVETGSVEDAYSLAADYDRDAILLMAKREGREDLLPLFGMDRQGMALPVVRDTALQKFARWCAAMRAA